MENRLNRKNLYRQQKLADSAASVEILTGLVRAKPSVATENESSNRKTKPKSLYFIFDSPKVLNYFPACSTCNVENQLRVT
jgi:hypothetical protein